MAAQEYLDAAKSSREGRTAGVPYNFEFYVPDEEASPGTRPWGEVRACAHAACTLNTRCTFYLLRFNAVHNLLLVFHGGNQCLFSLF